MRALPAHPTVRTTLRAARKEKTVVKPETKDSRRRRDLARIYIAARQLGLSGDAYRAMLRRVAGVESAAGLDETGRKAVLAHLKKAGFTARRYPGRPKIDALAGTGKKAMLEKIEAHLAQARRPWAYVHAMAKKMFKIERVQWCHPVQLHKIIAALEYDARRSKRKPQSTPGRSK
jgi:phage gp16-like protein